MRNKILRIKEIVIENKLYPRESVNKIIVKRYKEDMIKGDRFPPMYVAFFKNKYYLIDGRHRYEAILLLGDEHTSCEVKENFTNFDEMILASIRANLRHGHQLNKADKLKIAYMLKDIDYEIEDISKITGFKIDTLERSFSDKISRIVVGKKVKSRELPEKLSFKEKPKKDRGVGVIDTEGKLVSNKELKDDNDIAQLGEIYRYLKYTKFNIINSKINNLLYKIEKLNIWRKK